MFQWWRESMDHTFPIKSSMALFRLIFDSLIQIGMRSTNMHNNIVK